MLVPDEAAGRGWVVALYSGKGGTGRTSIAVNLAALLATDHHRQVVAVDMDLQFGDLATVIPTADDHPSIADLGSAAVEDLDMDFLNTCLIPGPGGFKVLACPPRPELSELVTPAHVTRVLALLRQRFDMIVVDCGAHLSDTTTAVTDTADLILLVTAATTPSLKSLRLASVLLEVLGVPERRLQVVLNHPDEHADFSDADVLANLTHRVAAVLPHDSRTAVTALDSGEPFVFTKPKSALGAAVRRLAADLANKTTSRGDVAGVLVS